MDIDIEHILNQSLFLSHTTVLGSEMNSTETLQKVPLKFNGSIAVPNSTLFGVDYGQQNGELRLTDDQLETLLGPMRGSMNTVIPMTIVYLMIFLTGVVGNVCTCVVIQRNRYMHTATNFYLFSLAISDLLLLLLGLPAEFYELWSRYPYIFGEKFCVIRGLCAETSANASILTITAFTVERYVAICHPIQAHTISRPSRAIKFIICVWVLATMCAIPLALQFGLAYKKTTEGHQLWQTAQCTVIVNFPHAFEVSTFLFFCLPTGVILVLYALIGIRLRQSSGNQRASPTNYNRQTPEFNGQSNHARHHGGNSRRTVIKMLGKFQNFDIIAAN